MAKAVTIKVKLVSTADTGYFYVTKKNSRTKTDKLSFKKYEGLITKKVHFFSHFVPEGCPLALAPLLSLIELVSYTARAGSLGIRLFANIVAGHALLNILSTFLLKFFQSEHL